MDKGKPLTPDELGKLSDENRSKLLELQEGLEGEALETVLKIQDIGEDFYKQFLELDRRTVLFGIKHLVDSIKEQYAGLDGVIQHAQAIQEDIVENAGKLREDDKGTQT